MTSVEPLLPTVVIGSSLSGLICAYELGKRGNEVIVLEREVEFGGRSRYDISGINLVNSVAQRVQGVKDSSLRFIQDIAQAAQGTHCPHYVDYLSRAAMTSDGHSVSIIPSISQTPQTVDDSDVSVARWLELEFGINFLTKVVRAGGNTVSRTHLPIDLDIHSSDKPLSSSAESGHSISQLLLVKLLFELNSMDNVHLWSLANVSKLRPIAGPSSTASDCTATSVIEHRVTPLVSHSAGLFTPTEVSYNRAPDAAAVTEIITIVAHTVIVATGSFLGDASGRSLLASVSAGSCGHAMSTAAACCDGSGIKMVRDMVGGNIIDLGVLHRDPCGLIDNKNPQAVAKQVGPYLWRSAGAILINQHGRRFCNELGLSHNIVDSIRKHCHIHDSRLESGHGQAVAYLLFNQSVLQKLDSISAAGLSSDMHGTHFANAHEMCESMGIPIDSLLETMWSYNAGEDSFGKPCFPVQDFSASQPVCVVSVTPVLSHSLGGLQVNMLGQVLGTSIKGHVEPIVGGTIYALGRCAASLVSNFDLVEGNDLLQVIAGARRSAMRIHESLQHADAILGMQMNYMPVQLLYKEKFDLTKNFSHVHHSTSSATSIRLHAQEGDVLLDEEAEPMSMGLESEAKHVSDSMKKYGELEQRYSKPALSLFCFLLPSPLSEVCIKVGEGIRICCEVNNTTVVRQYTPLHGHSKGLLYIYLRTRPEQGSMSQVLHYLQPGDLVHMMGPVELHTEDFQRRSFDEWRNHLYPRRMAMLAVGAGLIPFLHMLEALSEQSLKEDSSILLIWIVENPCDLVLMSHLDSLSLSTLKVVYCISDYHTLLRDIPPERLNVGDFTSVMLLNHLESFFSSNEEVSSSTTDASCIMICAGQTMRERLLTMLKEAGYTCQKSHQGLSNVPRNDKPMVVVYS